MESDFAGIKKRTQNKRRKICNVFTVGPPNLGPSAASKYSHSKDLPGPGKIFKPQ